MIIMIFNDGPLRSNIKSTEHPVITDRMQLRSIDINVKYKRKEEFVFSCFEHMLQIDRS